jgi:two-component system, NarL family, sensor histidine kinase EvgS
MVQLVPVCAPHASGTIKNHLVLNCFQKKILSFLFLLCCLSYIGYAQASALDLTEQERAWLKEHPEIRLGFTEAFPPFVIVEDRELSGIEIEIIDLLQQIIGIKITVEINHWKDSIQKAKERRLDGLLLNIPELAEECQLIITKTYITWVTAIFIQSDSKHKINSINDLVGKRVSRVEGYLATKLFLEKVRGRIEIVKSASTLDAMKLVIENKVDAFIGSSFDHYLLAKHSLRGIRLSYIATNSPFHLGTSIRDDWPELISILNKGLDAIGKGELQKIKSKWIILPSEWTHQPITESERSWLNRHALFAFGAVSDNAPFEYVDYNGAFSGMTADYTKIIGEKLATTLQPTYVDSQGELSQLFDSGKVDIISAIKLPFEKDNNVHYSESYLQIPMVLVAKRDADFIEGIDALEDQRIVVIENSSAYNFLKRDYPMQPILVKRTMKEALISVQKGEVKVLLANTAAVDYFQRKFGITDLKVAATTPYTFELAFAVRPAFSEMIPPLNKAIAQFSAQEKGLIFDKWVNQLIAREVDWQKVGFWGAALFVVVSFVIGIILSWNRRLSNEIKVRKQAEAAMLEAKRFAEAANLAKSEFLANMSHEIRTPMNAILGFAYILQKQETDPKKSHYVNNIYASGKSLLTLINDILDLSKIEAGKLDLQYSAISIAALVRELHIIFEQKIAEKGLDFRFEIDEQIPTALILDEIRLRQVLLNLLGNAVKFTDAGYIRLGVTSGWCDSLNRSRVNIVFEVEDTGKGISSEAQQKIFNPFEQTKGQKAADFGGTGLGLTISRRLAEMMGGDILVESDSGSGSTFRVTLPEVEVATIEATENGSEIGFNADIIHFEPAKILIVDDIDYNREMMSIYLEDWPFTIYEAWNGKEAIEQARLHQPDLILLDMKMPVMDGYQAAEILKQEEQLKAIPILAVTASALKEDEANISRLCEAYLRKPVSKNDLTKQLMRFLHYTQIAEPSGIPSAVPDTVRQKITPEDFMALPSEWLEAFLRAVREADTDLCLSLIKELPQTALGLSRTLEGMIGDYGFGTLIEIIERTKDTKWRKHET